MNPKDMVKKLPSLQGHKDLVDSLKSASDTIKVGKLAVGVEYALKKLIKIRSAEAHLRQGMAKTTCAKVGDKGVSLPPFLKKALHLLAGKTAVAA